jgi:fatty-acyl-CoA synthase
VSGPYTFPAVLARTVAEHGDAEAFVAPGERRTWRDLEAGARRMAALLVARGVRPGDHVGVLMPNCARWVETFYACGLIGAVTVPVNTRFRTDELAYCLRQANVSTLVYVDAFLNIDFTGLLRAVAPEIDTRLPGDQLPRLERVLMTGDGPCPAGAERLDDALARIPADAAAEVARRSAAVREDDVLLIQYTSGTTSFPKGVMLTHANMLRDAEAAAVRIGVQPDDRYFSIRPYYHVAGTTLSLFVSLTAGCTLLTLPSFDVAASLRMLDAERCTLISGNDTIFLMLLGHPDFDPAKIHLRGGWAAAGPEVMQKIRDVMGVPYICNAYGLSEASPNVVLSAWDDPFELRAHGWAHTHPGLEIRTVDPETGRVTGAGDPGEIQVRGWSIMKGYYEMQEATAKAITPEGWLRTGDLGVMDAGGRLRMVGRLKDVFRVGGENVAPAEVEETLHAHPAVQMAQVVGVPDARLGEVPAAFVILKPGQAATEEELVGWCRARCANFKVPRYLALVTTFEDIGMTGSSKVQKTKLREHALRAFGLQAKAG